jgi:polysaccharide export outer membrane protein
MALLFLLEMAGCTRGIPVDAVQAPQKVSADLSGYELGSGDRVRLIVYDEPNLSGEFTVDGRGGLALPLVGKVKAEGLTAAQLESRITKRLSPEYLKDPSVSVEVITYRPFYIVGEVKKPGSYPYVNGMSIINAVAVAGGFTYRARESVFGIDRTIDGRAKKFVGSPGTEVMPGDVITVPERYF